MKQTRNLLALLPIIALAMFAALPALAAPSGASPPSEIVSYIDDISAEIAALEYRATTVDLRAIAEYPAIEQNESVKAITHYGGPIDHSDSTTLIRRPRDALSADGFSGPAFQALPAG